MLVKLTESGLSLFGVGGDQALKNVHNDRAYHLMSNGHANKDSGFMSLYERNNPEPKKVEAKKEKATSKKAAARETAVNKRGES